MFTPREAAAFDRYILTTPYEQESIIEKHHYDDPIFTGEFDPYEDERHAPNRDRHQLTRDEQRKGGLATVARYGVEHMRAIARKGGERYNQLYVATGLRTGRHNTPTPTPTPTKDTTDDTLPY